MKNIIKNSMRYQYLLTIGSLLLLSACHQEFTLLDSHNLIVGNGSLESSANSPSPVKAVINGKVFTGIWKAENVYEADMAKMHRLLGTRASNEYLIGNSSHQLKHGQALLTAQDGTHMECDFDYRTQPVSGSCNIDQSVLTIKF
jgi:hypothetical protein